MLYPRLTEVPCSLTSEKPWFARALNTWPRSIGVNEKFPGGATPSGTCTPSAASSDLNSSIRRSSTGSRSRRRLSPSGSSRRIFWMARATIRAASTRLRGLVFSRVRSARPAVTRRSRSSEAASRNSDKPPLFFSGMFVRSKAMASVTGPSATTSAATVKSTVARRERARRRPNMAVQHKPAEGMIPQSIMYILLALGLLLFLPKLGMPLLDPDEGLYASIAREMLARGDWIVPHVNGLPYLEKPPLYFWLTPLTFKLFGPSEWATRVWRAMSALATVLPTCRTGR